MFWNGPQFLQGKGEEKNQGNGVTISRLLELQVSLQMLLMHKHCYFLGDQSSN